LIQALTLVSDARRIITDRHKKSIINYKKYIIF